MSQQTLDYRSSPNAREPNTGAATGAALLASAVTLIVNAGLVMLADDDRSWGALAIMFMIGSIVNGIMAVASLVFIPLVRRLATEAPIATYVWTGTLLPIAAIVVDGIYIYSMDLHGC